MKRIFICCPLVLAALLLTLGIKAQQASAQSAVAASAQADYQWISAIADNALIGTHKAVHGSVRTVGPLAFSDSAEAAFLAEWPDGARGIYTRSGRAVIEEGATVGGTVVEHLLNAAPGAIQIDRTGGRVGFVANIRGRGCPPTSPTCTGLFLEKQLMAVSAGGNAGFLLTDSGQIQNVPGAVWFLPAAGGAAPSGGKPDVFKEVGKHVGGIFRLPPIKLGTGGATVQIGGSTGGTQQPGQIQIGGANVPSQPQAVQAPQPAAFPPAPTQAACSTPMQGNRFPFPSLWPDSASAAGPISSMISEGALWGQYYRPVAQVQVTGWSRKSFYASDCRPILVAIAPMPGPGAYELWSPAGMLTAFDPAKGTYHFDGAGEAVLPPSSSPIENGVRINRSCRVLVPVTLRKSSGEEPALLLGAPTKPGHCPTE